MKILLLFTVLKREIESQLNFPMASKIKDQIFFKKMNEWMNEMSGKRLGDVVALWRMAVCSGSGSLQWQWQFTLLKKGRRYCIIVDLWIVDCIIVNCGWRCSVWLAVCFPQLSVSSQSKELNKVPLVCYSSPVCCVV
jgi:hypothetical protein